ncbi:PAS domain S-box protein [Natronosalvus rutilus]|uniref:histidine kinase n=1 Tax=Natronosalvus rutilus TaxID=2953753 RepID=A0A9E7NB05_9EURY|nr:PAS domain S-box protein [Natronosalvus rutilus]UTF53585.1 PAS domain S-box protein [Natronosalvus rutilus]
MQPEPLTDSLRETLAVFDGSDEPWTTPEVAAVLDLGRRSTYARLERLVERDCLETKKVGANARVWWRPTRTSATDETLTDWPSDSPDAIETLLESVEETAVFALSVDGAVRFWTSGAERTFGYEPDAIIGEHLSVLHTDDDREAGVPDRHLKRTSERGLIRDEGWRVCADGSRFWAAVKLEAVRDDGSLRGYAAVVHDITDRRKRERELRQERDLTERLLETAPVGLAVAQADGTVERINTRARNHLDVETTEVSRLTVDDFDVAGLDGNPLTATDNPVSRAVETGESVSDRLVTREGSDGTRRWISVTATPLLEEGIVERVVIAGRDVSRLRRKQRQLERQHEELRTELDEVFERISDGFMAVDERWELTYLNDTAAAMFDRNEEGLLGEPIWEALPGLSGTDFEVAYREAMETQEPTVVDAYYPPFDAWYRDVAYPSESGLSIYFQDITERKEAETALRDSEERLRLALEAGELGAWELDLQTEASPERSPRHDRIFGYEDPVDDWSFERFLEHVHPADRDRVERQFEAAFESGEWSFECRILGADGELRWIRARGEFFFEDGDPVRAVGVVADVTDRKERERELEQYERAVETIDDGVYILDDDHRVKMVNDGFLSMTGYDRGKLVGEPAETVFSPESVDLADEKQTELESGDREFAVLEEVIHRADGTSIDVESRFEVFEFDDGSTGRVGTVRDISERVERERELEEVRRRYRTLVDHFPNGAVALVDEDLRYVTFGGTPEGTTDVTRGALEGDLLEDALPEQIAEVVVPRYEAALEGEGATFEETVDDRVYQFFFAPVRDADGDVFAAMGMSQDITERKRHENRLEALYESSRRFLTADTASAIGKTLTETAQEVLDLPGIVVYDYDDDRNRLVPGGSSAESGFMRDDFPVVSLDERSLTGHVFDCGENRYYENVLESPFLQVSPEETEMRAGLFVPLGSEGVLIAGSREVDGLDASTRRLVALLATNAEAAYERVNNERALKRQHEQLAALNSLNEVVREITDAVIDQSTREEIEATVCEHLAESDSYLFAWIGDVDTTQTVNLRTEAGVDGYLDGVTITVDADDDRSEGPTGRALRTGEIQTTQDIDTDARYDPWRDRVEPYGFRSSAVVPIVHEGTVYGVLNVYAERANAFEGQECALIGQLGEIVGHAIAAADRKQALMSDELVELEFRIQDIFATVEAPVETAGTITLDQAVQIEDDEYLVYGTATPDAVDGVAGLTEAIPHWKDVTFRSAGSPTGFVLRLSSPPVLSVVASLGGVVERVVIEDGDYRMTIHLAPTVDVRRVIDAVEASYPNVEMVRRRQITRPHDDPQRIQRQLVADLTDRQRAALNAAYHAGYFEWPRESSGEDVAASLDVAPPTFHQHLRKAERKVLDSLFSNEVQAEG